ncbi:MAG TPA: hypothetical protein V6D26_28780 [Stenomitos sp.]
MVRGQKQLIPERSQTAGMPIGGIQTPIAESQSLQLKEIRACAFHY